MTVSVTRKNIEVRATMTNTMAVVIQTSFQVGHVTFDTSWRTSSMKVNGFFTPQPTILSDTPRASRPTFLMLFINTA